MCNDVLYESYTILIPYLCRSLSRVVKLWEKIVAEAMSSWVRKHTLRVTSPKGRWEGRKSLLTYRLAYLFQNAPNLGKNDNLSKET